MSGQEPAARLDELETRLAFQDDLVESLNRMVAAQDRELEKLRRRLAELERKLSDLAESASLPGAASGHEPPPHY